MQVKPIEKRTDLRQEAERLIDTEDFAGAYALLKAIWQEQPGPASARYLISKSREIAAKVPLINCRVALLRSFTVEPIIPLLQAAALVQGIEIEIYLSDFNTYAQEILNPQSGLYQFNPNVVFFAVQTRDLVPTLWEDFVSLSQEKYQETIEQARSNLISLFEVFQKNSRASLVVHTLEQLHLPSQGILDWQMEVSQAQAITAINQVLYQKALQQNGLYLLDYDGLISRWGRSRWYDESKWLTMRMPIAADCLIHLANEWLRFLHPLTGRICKCLVVDLDNTLWGGVIGEEGMIGIALGSEYPGAAFRQFQQAILDLYKRGIVLAICSKNNPTEAIEVLEKHPDMLLRLEHFAAIKINWQDKAQNLQEIARELNIGIDSLAFVDDNPAEREWIQQQLPEVTVIDLPSNPLGYAAALRQSPVFERLTLSSEDSQRGRYYAEQRQRQALAQSATSLEDFYYSLQMRLQVSLVTAATLARTAQLTQKTNQFNLTTKRRREPEIADLMSRSDWRIYTCGLRDRFGDNGLIGVVIGHQKGKILEIDTFLISCRVIGRTVETAILSVVMEKARQQGATELVGWYLPSKKNTPAKDFYSDHGFCCIQRQGESELWAKDLLDETIKVPAWIEVDY